MGIKRFFLSQVSGSRDGTGTMCTLREVVLELKDGDFLPFLDGPEYESKMHVGDFASAAATADEEAIAAAKANLPADDEMFRIRYADHMAAVMDRSDEDPDMFRAVRFFARATSEDIVEAASTAEALMIARDIDLPELEDGDRLLCIRGKDGDNRAAVVLQEQKVRWTGMNRGIDGSFDAWYPGLAEAIEERRRKASEPAMAV